jgi:hypothetical protein
MFSRASRVAVVCLALPVFAGCSASSDEDQVSPPDESDVVAAAEWQEVRADVDTKGAALVARPGALFLRTESAFLRGSEDGTSFEAIAMGELSERVQAGNLSSVRRAIAIDTHDANVIYRGTGSVVEKSTDGGKTFATLLDGATLPEKNEGGLGSQASTPKWVHDINVSPADSNVLYVMLEGGTWGSSTSPNVWLMRSTDGGATWSDITAPAGTQRVVWASERIEAHPTNKDSFFVLHPSMTGGRDTGRALYASDDGGASYRAVGSGTGYYPLTVVGEGNDTFSVHQADGRMSNPGVCIRDASGAERSCHRIGATPQEATRFSGIAYLGNDTFYVAVTAGERSAIFESSDGARTWRKTTHDDFPKVSSLVASADRRSVFAATATGLYRLRR